MGDRPPSIAILGNQPAGASSADWAAERPPQQHRRLTHPRHKKARRQTKENRNRVRDPQRFHLFPLERQSSQCQMSSAALGVENVGVHVLTRCEHVIQTSKSRCRALAEQVECRDAPVERHEVVGRPANKADLQGLVFNLTTTTISAAFSVAVPCPAWLIGAVHLALPRPPLLAAPASFSVAVAVAMADKCSVMCRVLSLHVLVCLSVRLSSLLPFPVSLSPPPLFPCISSTARVARHTYRLHLAFLIRNPSKMRVHHDSFHQVISPTSSSMLNSTALSLHLLPPLIFLSCTLLLLALLACPLHSSRCSSSKLSSSYGSTEACKCESLAPTFGATWFRS